MTSMTAPDGLRQARCGGVDTHKATHHAAVIDAGGARVADAQFPTSVAGCAALVTWLTGQGAWRVGVEQTGTYGAGLTRALSAAGAVVVEVNQPDLCVRAMHGKSDPIDAYMAAEAVRAGRARAVPKDRTGVVEAIRMLHTVRRSAVKDRRAALAEIADLAITVPAQLRAALGGRSREIARAALHLRPDPARIGEPTQAAKSALRSLARRVRALDEQIADLDEDLAGLVTTTAPHLLERPYVGINAAAQLLVTAGQNIERLHSEAAFARLCGVAPIPASSGKSTRMRLHRGGDRAANSTIHLIAVGRLRSHQPAIDYLTRRRSQGLSTQDAIRAMKRLIARELYGALKADLKALDAI